MAKWFPRPDNRPGINKALLAGCVGAFVVAAVYAYDSAARALEFWKFSARLPFELETSLLVGWAGRTLMALVAAWRFAIGKGLVWGLVVLLVSLLPVLGDFVFGTAAKNIGWVVIRITTGVALIIGVRAAWHARRWQPSPDYGEVFE